MSAKTMAAYIAKARQKTKTKLVGTQAGVKARVDQVYNNTGGAVFKVTPWDQLTRFLILGSEGGTYYATERKLTIENANCIKKCVKEDGISAVDMIVEISKTARAPKNDPALLALAIAATSGDSETRGYAMAMLPEVARTGTHLFHFVEFANALRGWGRLLREGVANWYNRLDETKLSNQLIKYQQRDGWSHRDLLRLAHPRPDSPLRSNLYRYVVKGAEGIKTGELMPEIIIAFEKAKTANTKELVKLITDYGLTREMVPTEKLNEVSVWEALLDNMPMTAMIRNLGKMTNIGLLATNSEATIEVVNSITDGNTLKKARVHPFTLLLALNQYSEGRGLKGSLAWTPVVQVKNALNDGFYKSFGYIEPSGKRVLLSLDVSGSMHGGRIAGSSITPAMGAAAMSMVTMRSEDQLNWNIMGFGTQYRKLNFTPGMNLDDIVNVTRGMQFGATNISLPMQWALNNRLKFDTFVIYTDNENNTGHVQPFEALRQYRERTGIAAKLISVAMTASKYTVADPTDAGMLDVVGFDSAAPQVIADFAADRF